PAGLASATLESETARSAVVAAQPGVVGLARAHPMRLFGGLAAGSHRLKGRQPLVGLVIRAEFAAVDDDERAVVVAESLEVHPLGQPAAAKPVLRVRINRLHGAGRDKAAQ